MDNESEILKGLLEGCVLELIEHEETYGYEITQSLRQAGFTSIVEGTVYAILVRLERGNYIYSEKKPSDKGPTRKFYKLTHEGYIARDKFWRTWADVSQMINGIRRK